MTSNSTISTFVILTAIDFFTFYKAFPISCGGFKIRPKEYLTRLGRRLLDSLAWRIAERLRTNALLTAAPAQPSGPVIPLDYPIHPRVRWGNAWGLPVHAAIEEVIWRNEGPIKASLSTIASYRDALRKIPERAPEEADTPRWINGWLPGLDGAAIYAWVREYKPVTYWEVGSGNSTRFARQAIADGHLQTRIVSIDPSPRAEIDRLCDEVLRAPLEDVAGTLLQRISPGDVCFIDCSHRAFQNSDVTVAMLELLPSLPPDVIIGFHDIFLPDDYPPEWVERYYNEQYLLAMFLLGGHAGMEIVLPAWAVSRKTEFAEMVASIWDGDEFAETERHGDAFWLRSLTR